ncbi:MAG: transglycosylase domain-containing protein [Deltaproteobacteria bacterium]|nr:transglycosylase domain-containing protein [Deltaproteobacteria bacterium]
MSRKSSLHLLFHPFGTVSTAAHNGFLLDYSLLRLWLKRIFVALLFMGALGYELRTSTLEAWLLSHYAARLSYEVLPGPSPSIVFPHSGPTDERRGYSRIPLFQSRLEAQGYHVAEQARVAPELAQLMNWGVPSPYREPAEAGLVIRGSGGRTLYKSVNTDLFQQFEDIPPLLVRTLLFLENRQLEDSSNPYSNPVIEWDRLAKAGFLYAGSKLGLPFSVQGGSTLATQLEKFRYFPQGRTHSVADKLRQMVGASLKAYRDGSDTRSWRRKIVVDYLDSIPLAAAPAYGEVNGLGEGLYAFFGLKLPDVSDALASEGLTFAKVHAFKHVLALLVALPAPTTYLLEDRVALEDRVNQFAWLLAKAGVIDKEFAQALEKTSIRFLPSAPVSPPQSVTQQRAPNAIRATLMQLLDVPDLYDLGRLRLEVETTIDGALQDGVTQLLHRLADPDFVAAHRLNQERLLPQGDPGKVVYSFLLFERTPEGNLLRAQADTLDKPFDINKSAKLQLGSTAKLRTLAHYLELAAMLYRELSPLDGETLARRARDAPDPITQWAADILKRERDLSLDAFLQLALERRYSASPYEAFFTGGGIHSFENFDRQDNGRIVSLRQGFQQSINLAFIRLMRDLMRFHKARLPYDAEAVLSDPDHPERRRLLQLAADEESKDILFRTYQGYRGLSPDAIVSRLLGSRAKSDRRLAILFFAWHQGTDEEALAAWLKQRQEAVTLEQVRRLWRAYGDPSLNLSDYGYLLSRHPLEVWCAGELMWNPKLSWDELLGRSVDARQVISAWLFQKRHRREQDLRLRIQIEKEAFARMAPYWQRLGFPFKHLVPSYATAIGDSSDRPAALAELMGIILNDGVRRPTLSLKKLHFARGTPYETQFEPIGDSGKQVMEPTVARAIRTLLADVVDVGTARRVRGAFVRPDGTPVVVGGKTGSGDNRFKTFSRGGQVLSSRAVNRTATFVFYIGERYFGVLTAFVPGHEAGGYRFTSALPVTVLKLLAPAIDARLG